jgi:hypothetical protein
MNNPFKAPEFSTIVKKQLDTAKLSLLDAERDLEVATARLQMARTTVARLSSHLNTLSSTVKEVK